MKIPDIAERALDAVCEALTGMAEPECTRFLISDAVVVRKGNHFAIEPTGDDHTELESLARRLEGLCDCGALLSSRNERLLCRVCGSEYRWH